MGVRVTETKIKTDPTIERTYPRLVRHMKTNSILYMPNHLGGFVIKAENGQEPGAWLNLSPKEQDRMNDFLGEITLANAD